MTGRTLKKVYTLILGLLFVLITAVPAVSGAILREPLNEADFDFDAWESGGGYVSTQEFAYDYFINGMFGSCGDTFQTGDWTIESTKLTLVYSTSQLINISASDLTVKINGQSVYSGLFEGTNAEQKELVIDIPNRVINPNAYNAIAIDLYVRSHNGGGHEEGYDDFDDCTDLIASSNWLNIFKESHIDIAYTPALVVDSIQKFYEQLISIDGMQLKTSAVLVFGDSDEAMTAAARAGAGLATNTRLDYTNMAFIGNAKPALLKSYKTALCFSAYAELPKELEALLSPEQKKAASTGAVAVLTRYGGSDILIVTGNDAESLKNSGTMLANADYMRQLTSTYKAISSDEDFTTESFVFEQYQALTDTGTYVNGAYRRSASYFIEMPANRMLAESSEISLEVRYSDNLDYDRSMVSVLIDGTPIGSEKLTEKGAKGLSVKVPVPADIKVAGGFTVEVAFDLDIGDDWCRLTREQMPWGYVAPTSMIKINTLDVQDIRFENFPCPFLRDGAFNDIVMALPENPSQADMQTAYNIAATLGRYMRTNQGELNVISAPSDEALIDTNIIAIGNAPSNHVILSNLASMPLPFSSDGRILLSNEKIKLDAEYGAIVGTGQMIQSPYSENSHALMIVSGVNDDALLRAAAFLCDVDEIWKLEGDAYIADDEDAYCYTFNKPVTAHELETLPEEKREAAVSVLIIAVMTLALCAVALFMLIRKKNSLGGAK